MPTRAYVLLGLAACSTGPPPLTDADYDAVARSVATSTFTAGGGGDVGAMTDSVLLAGGNLPLGFTVDAAGAIHGQHLGLAYRYALACRDGEGTIQFCNPHAELADVHVQWTGTLSAAGFSGTVARVGAWSLAGMHAPAIALAGVGHFSYDGTIEHAASRLEIDAVYIGIRVDRVSMLATGGELRYAITATIASTTFEIDATVTFAPDSTATITLDTRHAYRVDLVTGRMDRVP